MFKEVVVMYRTEGQGRASKASASVPASARDPAVRLKDILMRRNIHIKWVGVCLHVCVYLCASAQCTRVCALAGSWMGLYPATPQ